MAKRPSVSTVDTVQQDEGTPRVAITYALYVLHTPDERLNGYVRRLGEETLQIGRKVGDEHLSVTDPAVSKAHAEITWSPVRERHLLGDLRSSNGTHLDGKQIQRELLNSGDILRIGDTVFRFAPYDANADGWSAPSDGLFRGASLSLRQTIEMAASAARSDMSVLILGETGTGKELVAQTIHDMSGAKGDLVAFNCAAIPSELVESELFGHVKGAFSGADTEQRGLFRAADGGTLFLDELGELATDTQAKLLRALETKQIRPVGASKPVKVDVRVVAATNRDLEQGVAQGEFRADLYARLAEWIVSIDPLRDRPEDVFPLWKHFTAMHGSGTELTMKGSTFEALALHRWPYNVRELSALVRRLLVSHPDGAKLSINDLPEAMKTRDSASSDRPTLDDLPNNLPPKGETPTARELQQLVEKFSGNVKEVAAFLGKDRTQVYRWLKKHDIDPNGYR